MNQNPVAVMSFNRPHYLRPVLESLSAQTALNGRPVCLFQDNAVSPYSGHRFATDESIEECVDLFRAAFPAGKIFLAEHNLGVARNFKRAEEFVFRELAAEAAYFFEDDMVLSPHYLTMMDYIHANIAAADKVGYFAAYGNHRLSLQEQMAQRRKMGRLDFHWAFGLTRQCWLALSEWLEPYYRMSEGADYRRKPGAQITEYYRSRGFPADQSTQDHIKKVGAYSLGRVSINTHACFGRYIGEHGLHTTPEKFAARNYAQTELFPEPVELDFPTADEIARYRDDEIASRWRGVEEEPARIAAKRAAKAQLKTASRPEP